MVPTKQKGSPARKRLGKRYAEVITTHVNADFDALASMIAAGKLYPNAALVFPGSQEQSLRNFFLNTTSYLFNLVKIREVDLSGIQRLIIVDTRQKSRIGKFSELIGKKDLEIHIYDHHPPSEDDVQGEFELTGRAGSTTALLADLLREREIAVSSDEATLSKGFCP